MAAHDQRQWRLAALEPILPRMTWPRSVLLSTTKERTVGSGTDLLHLQQQAHWLTAHSILPLAHYGLACDALEACLVAYTLLAHVRVTCTVYRHQIDDGTHIGERCRRDRFSIEKRYRTAWRRSRAAARTVGEGVREPHRAGWFPTSGFLPTSSSTEKPMPAPTVCISLPSPSRSHETLRV